MTDSTIRDTHRKALELNLDPSIFGSFAEIGAGQEVARWFLRVGAASGTVAKTVSAYDKEISDDLYGTGTRYVSRPRLEAMLEKEWAELKAQMHATRGPTARLFTFTNTVAARNYAGTNECHGWMGIRYQDRPEGEPSEVIVHINMRDDTAVGQQEALGILGVNLVWSVFQENKDPERFLASLFEGLEAGRIEVDLVAPTGPALGDGDAGTLLMGLVRGGHAEAVFFPQEGPPVPPTEILHKKAVVIVPEIFSVVEPVAANVMEAALDALRQECGEKKNPLGFSSVTVSGEGEDGEPPVSELRRRVEALSAIGAGVLLCRPRELYRQTSFVNRFTSEPVRFAVSVGVLVQVLQGYLGLEGRILEGVSRLLARNVRLYVYPMSSEDLRKRLGQTVGKKWIPDGAGELVGADRVRPTPPLGHLYDYLLASEFIRPMELLGSPAQ